jgi:hypothetical protein
LEIAYNKSQSKFFNNIKVGRENKEQPLSNEINIKNFIKSMQILSINLIINMISNNKELLKTGNSEELLKTGINNIMNMNQPYPDTFATNFCNIFNCKILIVNFDDSSHFNLLRALFRNPEIETETTDHLVIINYGESHFICLTLVNGDFEQRKNLFNMIDNYLKLNKCVFTNIRVL